MTQTSVESPGAAQAYAARLARLRAQLGTAGVGACLVGPSSDLQYLTGLNLHASERLSLLGVPATGPAFLLAPAFEAAGLPALSADITVVPWQETDDPAARAAALLTAALPGATAPIAVGDRLWAVFLLRLQAALPQARWIPAAGVLDPLRVAKDGQEVALLAAAGAAADAAFSEIVQLSFAGRSERAVAADIAGLLRQRGIAVEWGPIVGSGPNGASPHHTAGDRVIQEGDLVVLDFGGVLNGYNADMTRTVAVGREPDAEARHVYDLVYAGQERGVQAARPGITGEALDAAVRDFFTAQGYGAYFTHRLGHGVGLDGHEPPYIVSGNQAPLAPGMAFSVEPGLYLAGRFGVRIEDVVVLTADGAQRMNNAPRELVIVR